MVPAFFIFRPSVTFKDSETQFIFTGNFHKILNFPEITPG